MRPTRTRRRHLKEIAPVLRSTWDGRPLLPQEVPIVSVEPMPAADTDPLEAALAMFDDMLSRPAPRVATPIGRVDQWGMIRAGDSGPLLVDATVDEALPGEPTLDACAPDGLRPAGAIAGGHGDPQRVPMFEEGAPAQEMVADGWGDSGDLIEDWFRTGEFLAAESPEPMPRVPWLRGILQRVRRAWSGIPAATAWDAT